MGYLWYNDDGTVFKTLALDDGGGDGTVYNCNTWIVIFHARFKFSWKICNALLMMMMQRLNHRFVM